MSEVRTVVQNTSYGQLRVEWLDDRPVAVTVIVIRKRWWRRGYSYTSERDLLLPPLSPTRTGESGPSL